MVRRSNGGVKSGGRRMKAVTRRDPADDSSLETRIRRGNRRGRPHACSLQPFRRAHPNRSGVPAVALLHRRMARQRCRLLMIIRACDTEPADTGHCCPALLPTRVIAGQGIRAPGATERAPWIRVSRLRVADSRVAQQRGGNDKKCDDRRTRHCPSPSRRFCLAVRLSNGRRRRLYDVCNPSGALTTILPCTASADGCR